MEITRRGFFSGILGTVGLSIIPQFAPPPTDLWVPEPPIVEVPRKLWTLDNTMLGPAPLRWTAWEGKLDYRPGAVIGRTRDGREFRERSLVRFDLILPLDQGRAALLDEFDGRSSEVLIGRGGSLPEYRLREVSIAQFEFRPDGVRLTGWGLPD